MSGCLPSYRIDTLPCASFGGFVQDFLAHSQFRRYLIFAPVVREVWYIIAFAVTSVVLLPPPSCALSTTAYVRPRSAECASRGAVLRRGSRYSTAKVRCCQPPESNRPTACQGWHVARSGPGAILRSVSARPRRQLHMYRGR